MQLSSVRPSVRPSVRLSVRVHLIIRPPHAAAAGLLLWARPLTRGAEHRLVLTRCAITVVGRYKTPWFPALETKTSATSRRQVSSREQTSSSETRTGGDGRWLLISRRREISFPAPDSDRHTRRRRASWRCDVASTCEDLLHIVWQAA